MEVNTVLSYITSWVNLYVTKRMVRLINTKDRRAIQILSMDYDGLSSLFN
jgi:hypothetical protein